MVCLVSNHFIINFPQNEPVKKMTIGQYSIKNMDRTVWLTFKGHPVYKRATRYARSTAQYTVDGRNTTLLLRRPWEGCAKYAYNSVYFLADRTY